MVYAIAGVSYNALTIDPSSGGRYVMTASATVFDSSSGGVFAVTAEVIVPVGLHARKTDGQVRDAIAAAILAQTSLVVASDDIYVPLVN